MKKPILYIQLRTDDSEEHERNYVNKMGKFKPGELHVVNAFRNSYDVPSPKELDNYAGVITGASAQFNMTDLSEENSKHVSNISGLFAEIIKRDIPTLAICFGHQMIAVMQGGEVETDSHQAEAGTIEITLNSKGKKSQLFEGMPNKFYVVEGHKDSVTKLPKNATLLASSKKCHVQSYRFKNNIYCVQFHPELTREGLVWRLSKYPEYLKGRTLDEVRVEFQPIPHAKRVLTNFKKIVYNNLI